MFYCTIRLRLNCVDVEVSHKPNFRTFRILSTSILCFIEFVTATPSVDSLLIFEIGVEEEFKEFNRYHKYNLSARNHL